MGASRTRALCLWVQGLCGGPDVAPGQTRGTTTSNATLTTRNLNNAADNTNGGAFNPNSTTRLSFRIGHRSTSASVGGHHHHQTIIHQSSPAAYWDAVLSGRTLYVALPGGGGMLPEGSRESFVTLLETAEEQLKCKHVVVVFANDRADRGNLVRTFMFLGFAVLSPTSPLLVNSPNIALGNVCMLYNIE